MMTSSRVFTTESIDLAAFLVATMHEVTVLLAAGGRRVLFEFSDTEELRNAIISYELNAILPAKRLLNSRSYLFREASRVVRSHTPPTKG
ncbi:hypothetical protein GHYDROH2_12550 [Geobacter hydrogenophilus]|uniref:DUF5659 domain-containing protein n=1 Tax=Geobacter hydrogenophilus TaxID=40983 RepID=A0A9W6LCF5_9BACT|nr:hypothetical protein GHYDROH2_12550 [Geobacter hydrogenophilus]